MTEKNYWYTRSPRRENLFFAAERPCRVPVCALARDERPGPTFTGKFGDRYYYRGRVWTGPTNALGSGKPHTLWKNETTWSVQPNA